MGEKITVIIPAYNAEKYLGECLNSVLTQTYSELEVIVIDDGSDDKSVEICREYMAKDKRVRLICQERGGVSKARNIGIDEATGEYLYFLDSDDLISRGVFSDLVGRMREYDAGIGITYIKWFGKEVRMSYPSVPEKRVLHLTGREALESLGENFTYTLPAIGGKLIRRSFIGDLRFRSDIISGEDTFFMYQLLLKERDVVIADGEYYFYRMHGNNTVSTRSVQAFESLIYVLEYISKSEGDAGRSDNMKQWRDYLIYAIVNWMDRSSANPDCVELRAKVKETLKRIRGTSAELCVGRTFKLRATCFRISGKLYNRLFVSPDIEVNCSGCGACVRVCPQGCIRMRKGAGGFVYPHRDDSKCTNCGRCEKVCPMIENNCLEEEQTYYSGDFLEIKKEICCQIIKNGGIVSGTALVDGRVCHIVAKSMDELDRIGNYDFVQSDMSGIYDRIKDALEAGTRVLFLGNPCLAEALRLFLGRDYRNLLLVDITCDGFVSSAVWGGYVKLLEQRYGGKLKSYDVEGNVIKAIFASGPKEWSRESDLLLRSMKEGRSIGACCGKCLYCSDRRYSDITLGDAIIAHSTKGRGVLNNSKICDIIARKERGDYVSARLVGSVPKTIRSGGNMLAYRLLPFRTWLGSFR